MQSTEITGNRRVKIFLTGLAPLLTLWIILSMAAQNELDVVSLFTKVEKRDAANYVVVTKLFGVPVSSRPATQADLVEEDIVMRVGKIAVLAVSFVVLGGALLMCYASITGKPRSVLIWIDSKLGSVRSSVPSLR